MLQERFRDPPNCVLKDELGDLNKWKFITLKPDPNKSCEDEIEEVYMDALQGLGTELSQFIKPGNFGAVNCEEDPAAPEGYYIVKWTGEPYVLQEPAMVEGFNAGPMQEGTLVCEGEYFHRVPGAPRWYQSNKSFHQDRSMRLEETKLFRVQWVLDPDIAMENHRKANAATRVPQHCLTSFQVQMADSWCKRVPVAANKWIQEEKKRRAVFDYVECTWESGNEETQQEEDMQEDSEGEEGEE